MFSSTVLVSFEAAIYCHRQHRDTVQGLLWNGDSSQALGQWSPRFWERQSSCMDVSCDTLLLLRAKEQALAHLFTFYSSVQLPERRWHQGGRQSLFPSKRQ